MILKRVQDDNVSPLNPEINSGQVLGVYYHLRGLTFALQVPCSRCFFIKIKKEVIENEY